MRHGDFQFEHPLVGNLCRGEVDVGKDVPQAHHGCLPAEGLQVGPDKPVRNIGHVVQIDVGGQGHSAGVDIEYLAPPRLVGDTDDDFPIESSRAAQGRVDVVRDVGGADDDHLSAAFQAVH